MISIIESEYSNEITFLRQRKLEGQEQNDWQEMTIWRPFPFQLSINKRLLFIYSKNEWMKDVIQEI